MKEYKKNELFLNGLGIASIFICTTLLMIPAGVLGYLHLGDAMIMLFSSISRSSSAFLIGAIASFLADLVLAPQYAIFTFLIKGMEACLIAFLCKKLNKKHMSIAFFIGGIVVVLGYACTDFILTKQPALIFTSVGINSIQIGVSILIASLSSTLFYKIMKFK